MPIRYLWVGDRKPRQKLCLWCQEPFAPDGYVHDPDTKLAYCSPDCCELHRRISEVYIASYTKIEEAARMQ